MICETLFTIFVSECFTIYFAIFYIILLVPYVFILLSSTLKLRFFTICFDICQIFLYFILIPFCFWQKLLYCFMFPLFLLKICLYYFVHVNGLF